MAELDHNPSPQRLVGQLTIAGEVVFGDDDVVDAGRDNEHNINFPQQKKIPLEMEVAPRCMLFSLLTWFTSLKWFTLLTWLTVLTWFTLLKWFTH